MTLLLRKQRAQDRIERREPLDWRDENYAIVGEIKVGRICTQRIHGEMRWLWSLQTDLHRLQIAGSDTLDESKARFDCGGEGTLVDVWLPIEIAAAALAHGS